MNDRPPYSRQQATKLIKTIVKKSHLNADYRISYTRHFCEELADDDLDMNDAHYILENGVVYDEPEFNLNHANWTYRVDGCPIDSKSKVILVVSFIGDRKIKLITIFKRKSI